MRLFIEASFQANAQINSGVYRLISNTSVPIGTDPDNKIFG